jgi:two-component system LytT family response regulator
VLLADDEPPARLTLRLLLARHADFAIAAECAHGQEAIDAVRAATPDVLFLDVQMPGIDGFDVLRSIGPDAVPALVFVTAYDQYALRAFETHALDYLLKPFSDERFDDVLGRVRARLRERAEAGVGARLSALLASRAAIPQRPQLVVRDGGRTLVIPCEEIVWIEAEDYYVRVHARTRRTLVRMSMRTLADSLEGDSFIRVHRSAIVNVACIREMEPLASGDQRLVLNDGTELRVSRTYRAALEERLSRGRPRLPPSTP